MKNLFAAVTVLLTVGSANAFFNTNAWDTPFNNNNGNAQDNGIFAYNGYDYFDPRWFSTEFTNMVNEVDDEFGNSEFANNSYYQTANHKQFPVSANK